MYIRCRKSETRITGEMQVLDYRTSSAMAATAGVSLGKTANNKALSPGPRDVFQV